MLSKFEEDDVQVKVDNARRTPTDDDRRQSQPHQNTSTWHIVPATR